MPDNPILLGVFGRAHGVRGLVRVTSHTAEPSDLTAYGPLTSADGRRFVLRWRNEGVAEVDELIGDKPVRVSDRSGAERLTNIGLFIDRAQLPAVDDNDEYYLNDLMGLDAVDPAGSTLGRVSVVHDYGAGASLEIVRDGAAPLLVPFTKACVPAVDLAARRLTVVLPDVLEAPDEERAA